MRSGKWEVRDKNKIFSLLTSHLTHHNYVIAQKSKT